jgi:hypothetical protein
MTCKILFVDDEPSVMDGYCMRGIDDQVQNHLVEFAGQPLRPGTFFPEAGTQTAHRRGGD